MNDRAGPSMALDHARHDELLVARFAAGDFEAAERTAAERLVASCPSCRELHSDIATLMQATPAALPVPRRRRDFRLSAAEADRLQGSLVDRLLARLAAPSLGVLQPLGAAAVAIGLVLVVANALPQSFMAGSAGGAPTMGAPAAPGATMAPPAAAPSAAEGYGGYQADSSTSTLAGAPASRAPDELTPAASSRGVGGYDAAGNPIPAGSPALRHSGEPARDRLSAEATPGGGGASAEAAAEAPTVPAWAIIGLLILLGGIAVLAARWIALRQMRDPRLH